MTIRPDGDAAAEMQHPTRLGRGGIEQDAHIFEPGGVAPPAAPPTAG